MDYVSSSENAYNASYRVLFKNSQSITIEANFHDFVMNNKIVQKFF